MPRDMGCRQQNGIPLCTAIIKYYLNETPILDNVKNYHCENPLITFDTAIKAAYLSFCGTYKNGSDVDFPIDFEPGHLHSRTGKNEEELQETSSEWNTILVDAAKNLPNFLHFDD